MIYIYIYIYKIIIPERQKLIRKKQDFILPDQTLSLTCRAVCVQIVEEMGSLEPMTSKNDH